MRLILLILFSFSFLALNAQDKVIVKYYDTLWNSCQKDSAKFYMTEQKDQSFFLQRYYSTNSNKLLFLTTVANDSARKRIGLHLSFSNDNKLKYLEYLNENEEPYSNFLFDSIGNIIDSIGFREKKMVAENINETLFKKGFAIFKRYYDNNQLQDSIYLGDSGRIFNSYHFYENGKLFVKANYNNLSKKVESNAFSSKGLPLQGFIDRKAAQFAGGAKAWLRFLERNLNRDLPVENGAPVGKYTVIINFLIDKEGNISNIIAENDPGYGTKQEALKVIQKSPSWQPAILYGNPAEFRHKQYITFNVAEEK